VCSNEDDLGGCVDRCGCVRECDEARRRRAVRWFKILDGDIWWGCGDVGVSINNDSSCAIILCCIMF
jgi:hypothetical protein